MTEQRFDIIYDCQGVTRLIDRENKLISLDFGFDWNDLDDYEKDRVKEWLVMLNKQQSTIEQKDKEIAELDQQCADFLGDKIKALEEFEECTDKLKAKILEQQATIRKLQDLCGESDGENAKLRIENKKLKAKLKEKEEDEQLYANEILELRETNKEFIQFKELGGDY